MKKYKIGYTAGTFDLFHVGHLNILKRAKSMCEFLIVAVSTDELVFEYKHHFPVIEFESRMRIVESIKYVDKVVPQINMNKKQAAIDNNIDVMFVGDDWKNTEKWKTIEKELNEIGVNVVFLPHTDGISSTDIKNKIIKKEF
mgnify:CR=1 FL=1